MGFKRRLPKWLERKKREFYSSKRGYPTVSSAIKAVSEVYKVCEDDLFLRPPETIKMI